MKSGTHFPQSPAKHSFLPCSYALRLLSTRLVVQQCPWGLLPTEVVFALLTDKISSIYFLSVQLNNLHFFSASSTCSFSESLLHTCNPVTQTVASRHFVITSVDYSLEWIGWQQTLETRLPLSICHCYCRFSWNCSHQSKAARQH